MIYKYDWNSIGQPVLKSLILFLIYILLSEAQWLFTRLIILKVLSDSGSPLDPTYRAIGRRKNRLIRPRATWIQTSEEKVTVTIK